MTFLGVFIHPFLFLCFVLLQHAHIYTLQIVINQHKDMQEKQQKQENPEKNKQSPLPPPEIALTAR